MKRSVNAIVAALIIFFMLGGLKAYAAEYSQPEDQDIIGEIEEAAGTDDISTPQGYKDDGKKDLFSSSLEIINENVSKIFGNVGKAFFSLLSIIILSSLLHSVKKLSSSSMLETAVDLVSVLAMAGITFSVLKTVFETAKDSLLALSSFLASLLPVTASLLTMSGNVSSATTSTSLMLLFNSLLTTAANNFLLPMLQISFALSLVSALPYGVSLQSITSLVKNAATTVLAFGFTMFSAILYFQNSIAASADNLAYRGIRFASGVFIPVIGSIVGDASRTVNAAIGTVKSSVGYTGVAVLFFLIIPPVVTVILYKLAVLFAAIIARMLGCERESRMLYDINSILSVLMSVMIGVSAVFLISVALFIKTGVSV